MKLFLTTVVGISLLCGQLQALEPSVPPSPVDYSIPNDQQLQAFYDSMIKSVNKAQEELDQIVTQGIDAKTAPAPDWMQQLDNAVFMLKVKYALAWNLRGAAALRSPLIREKILQILNKEAIEQSDVAELQTLINSERVQILDFDSKHQATRLLKQK